MARIRSVKPTLFGSYSIARVSLPARYLFVGLFCEADDSGRMIDSPKRIAGALFPHDEKVTERKVNGWLEELVGIGAIYRYEPPEGGRYLCFPKWEQHQKISHPMASTLPPPSKKDLDGFLSQTGGIPE